MDTLNAERGDTVTIANSGGGWGGTRTSNCLPLRPRGVDGFTDPLGTNNLANFISEVLVDGSCTTVTRRHTPCVTDGNSCKASTTYVVRLDDQLALPKDTHDHIMNTNTSADITSRCACTLSARTTTCPLSSTSWPPGLNHARTKTPGSTSPP